MSINKKDLLIWTVTALLAVILNKNIVFYFSYCIMIVIYMVNYIKSKESLVDSIFILLIYSSILPDNYTILATNILCAIIVVTKKITTKKFKLKINKDHKLKLSISLFILIGIIFNNVHFMNIAFYIIYSFGFYFIYIFMKEKQHDKKFMKKLECIFNTIIILEMINTIFILVFKLNIVLQNLFGDWSIGTFGTSHGYILFSLSCLGVFKYYNNFNISKEKKYVLMIILCFLMAVSTVNVSLTIMFFMAVLMYIFISKERLKNKIIVFITLLIFVGMFWTLSTPMIRWQIVNAATNKEFRSERLKKINGYEDTFFVIPEKDIKFALIGNGVGNYSSRAALTCTGKYIAAYNKFFKPVMNEYTKIYMTPEIYTMPNISIQQMPTSQIISIMGEFGLIGMLFFICVISKLILKSKEVNKLVLLLFLTLCFIDNWIEYAKFGLFLWCIYFIIESSNTNVEFGSEIDEA